MKGFKIISGNSKYFWGYSLKFKHSILYGIFATFEVSYLHFIDSRRYETCYILTNGDLVFHVLLSGRV